MCWWIHVGILKFSHSALSTPYFGLKIVPPVTFCPACHNILHILCCLMPYNVLLEHWIDLKHWHVDNNTSPKQYVSYILLKCNFNPNYPLWTNVPPVTLIQHHTNICPSVPKLCKFVFFIVGVCNQIYTKLYSKYNFTYMVH